MTMFVFASVAGSPGASSVAIGVAAAWPDRLRKRAVIEADADGGKFGAELGVGTEPGLMALTVAARARQLDAATLVGDGAAHMGEWWLVPAPASAEHSHAALGQAAGTLARTMAGEPSWLWVVDAGRLSPRATSMPFAAAADLVVLVTHGSLASLQLLPTRVDALVDSGCPVGVVVVGDSDWPLGEIADFCGCDVLGRIPTVRSRRGVVSSMRSAEWRPWWSAVRALTGVLLGADWYATATHAPPRPSLEEPS
jgi:MinD-like ATPase involved in chromosome partitioning or flagellar assembly